MIKINNCMVKINAWGMSFPVNGKNQTNMNVRIKDIIGTSAVE